VQAEDAKEAKKSVKYSTIASIDERLSSLVARQEGTSMSLRDEKELVKEIESLRATKSTLAVANDKALRSEASKDAAKAREKDLQAAIDGLQPLFKELSAAHSEAFDTLKALQEERNASKGTFVTLAKERQEANDAVTAKMAEVKALKDAHFSALREYDAYLAQARRQRYEQVQKERAAAAETAAASGTEVPVPATGAGAALEDDEGAFHPYAAQLETCDTLVTYFSRMKPKATSTPVASSTSTAALEIVGKDGAKIKAASRDEEKDANLAFLMGGSKAKKGSVKSTAAPPKAAPLSLGLDTLSTLRDLGIAIPSSVNDLDATIAAIRAKRAFYETAPPPTSSPSQSRKATGAATASIKVGANVRTPYGPATVLEVRKGAGKASNVTLVVSMKAFFATGYLNPDQVSQA
jgi:hypothetical protein